MYKFRGLANIKEDAFRLDHSDCSRPDLGHFLRHGPGMTKVHVGRWREHMSKDY